MDLNLILWIPQFLGHLHPLLVHFPIGILIVALFFEILEISGKQKGLGNAIYLLVLLGAVTSVLSVMAGLFLENSGNYEGNVVNTHKWMGIITAALALLSFFLLKQSKRNNRFSILFFRFSLVLSVVFLTLAGHVGALLTHGDDYISGLLPWNENHYDDSKTSALFVELSHSPDSLSLEQLDRLNLEVRAIFAHQCYQCHSEHKKKGGLVLENEDLTMLGGENGPVIIPGNARESELVRRLELPADHDDVMPRKGKKLTLEQIDLIKLWIDEGAHWADTEFRVFPEAPLALVKPHLPENKKGFDNPIDLWVERHFEENDVEWPGVVDDRIFLKRAFLDITGLLPLPEDYDSFMKENNPDKRKQLIERLLDKNTEYTQHWLSFWNDLLRNDYSGTGYITGGRKPITDWLYKSLMQNKPYDSMVMQLIDPLPESEGFIRGIQWRGDVNASQRVEMQAAQNVGQSLLGVNLKCASCHNSFISNLKLKQAYDFANIFTDSIMEIYRCGMPIGKTASPAFIYPELGEVSGNNSRERLTSLAQLMVKRENGRLYRTFVNRIWGKLLGRGIIERYDEMDNHPWSQDLLDWMAADFLDSGKDIKQLIASIMTSKTYQLPAVYYDKIESIRSDLYVFNGPLVRRMSAEQFADAVSQVVQPMYQSVSYDPFNTETPASWVWMREVEFDRDVLPKPGKRYFRYVFETDGKQKILEAPTLVTADHSFVLYMNGREVLSGNNWQEVKKADLSAYLLPGKNLLAIEAENEGKVANPAGVLFSMKILYDESNETQAIFSGKGWLVSQKPENDNWMTSLEEEGEWEEVKNQQRKHWGTLLNFTFEERDKRGIVRASLVQLDPFLKALGRPTRENVSTSRESQATLLQALELSNGEFFNTVLGKGAESWLSENNEYKYIGERLFRKALGRRPSKEEMDLIGKLLGPSPAKEDVQDLFWAVLLLPEFQFIY